MSPQLSARDISEKLSANTQAVCERYIPGGTIVGGEYCVGSVSGGEGKSLKVRTTGAKAGIWADFASSDKGDLLDLIRCVRGCTPAEAIREAKEFLGITDFKSIVPKKEYTKPPKKLTGVTKLTEESPVMAYLLRERKLTKETVTKFRIGDGGTEIVFPSFNQSGELDSVKYIGLARDNGKKVIRQEKGCPPSLFGWHALPVGTRTVVITEGQIDAMTWAQMGWPALSMPNGVGDINGWIDYEWDNLQQFDTIYLSFDSDEPGKKGLTEVAQRVGKQRCMNVVLAGEKDANDALQHGKDKAFFDEAINLAQPFKPKQIKSPLEFKDLVMEEFHPKGGVHPGFVPETLRKEFRFILGQLTIWTGISGHGKSNLLNQIALEFICGGGRVAMASMEMPGHKNLARMIRTAAPRSIKEITIDFLTGMLTEISGRLWIFDMLGNVQLKVLLELMAYSVARYKVEHFIIDSLMKLDVDSEDFDAQRQALNQLHSFAMEHNVHVHLVCHARKGQDESKAPGKLDVKGSGDIINQADNIISVWRNKKKEKEFSAGNLSEANRFKVPDCICYVEKNRETGEEGEIALWFNKKRNRYIPMTDAGEPVEILLIPRPIE